MPTALQPDLSGEKLNQQRFQMLEDIAEELSGEVVFPTCFDVALHIRNALQDNEQPISKIVTQVSMEPLIGSKLMSLANSVAFNPSGREVKDLKVAISLLGLENVRSAAMAITINQMMLSREMADFQHLAMGVWQHSITTASAAYVLAKRLTRLNADEAMMAGMVHDIGAFYMLYRVSKYNELCARPETIKFLISQWHESIGLSVLASFGMAEEIIEAVRDHDVLRPAPKTLRTFNDVVYVANMLAGGHAEWMHMDVDPATIDQFALGEEYLSLQEEIQTRAAEMRAVFN